MQVEVGAERPPIVLVLGAGGSVGHSFHIGVLSALADELGWDARTADLIVGTSAGSVLGASLRAGIGPHDMRARAQGAAPSPAGRDLISRAEQAIARVNVERPGERNGDGNGDGDADEPPTRLRRLKMASPERVRRALREPWRATPASVLSAMIPAGRLPTDHLGAPYDVLFDADWPPDPLWIVAVRLDVGTRVVFGRGRRHGELSASIGTAVRASCAVPGYFAPVVIEGERFIDGGVHSTTNADLARQATAVLGDGATAPLVIVSAPMSPERSTTELSPRSAVRQFARRALASELASLRADGIDVVTFQPTDADLGAMAGSSMDPSKAPAIIEQVNQTVRERLREPALADALAVIQR
jgi:NTE family protein